MIRTPQALLPWLFLLVALGGGLLWSASEMAGPGHAIVSGTAEVGGPFALVDQNGKPRRESDFRGLYRLVYFGYTNCPDVCPTTLAAIAQAFGKIGARKTKLVPLFISIDPERDSPKVLKAYLSAFGPEFVGLTGSTSAVNSVAREYRVYFARHPLASGGYAVDHSSLLYLMAPDGSFVTFYEDQSLEPDALAADLRKRIRG